MIDDKLNNIVADILEIEKDQVSDDLTQDSAEYWDSMNHLRLMTAIEQEFAISLSMEEIQSIHDVARLRELVKKHHVKAS